MTYEYAGNYWLEEHLPNLIKHTWLRWQLLYGFRFQVLLSLILLTGKVFTQAKRKLSILF
jgi:hypothetical protein